MLIPIASLCETDTNQKYEDIGKIKIPRELSSYKTKDVNIVESSFRQLGFTDIKTLPLNDVIFSKVDIRLNKVESVLIDGTDEWTANNSKVDPTAKVVI